MKRDILLIDDSLAVQVDLQQVFTAAGFAVTVCGTLASARAELAHHCYAAVILDVGLPDGDGIELLAELKHDPRLSQTPVLMLSTEAEIGARIRGMVQGADEYVGKPYDRAYLIRRVCELSKSSVGGGSAWTKGWFGNQKVLVTGDGSTARGSVLSEYLRRGGHDVVVARSSEEALDLLAVQIVDCIVLDVDALAASAMPTYRRIRDLPAGKQASVVILTSRDDTVVRSQWSTAGADEVVIKSPTFGVLRICLRRLLRNRHRGLAQAGPNDTANVLFSRVVAASGLLPAFASDIIVRACQRADVKAEQMSSGDLTVALPWIREALEEFLSPNEVSQRMDSIAALVKRSSRST